jgi:hypothetical protein
MSTAPTRTKEELIRSALVHHQVRLEEANRDLQSELEAIINPKPVADEPATVVPFPIVSEATATLPQWEWYCVKNCNSHYGYSVDRRHEGNVDKEDIGPFPTQAAAREWRKSQPAPR